MEKLNFDQMEVIAGGTFMSGCSAEELLIAFIGGWLFGGTVLLTCYLLQ